MKTPILILCALLTVLLTGCGQTTTRSNGARTVKEVTKETPTADGGRLIEKTTTASDSSEAIETTEVSPQTAGFLGSVASIAGPAIGMATGTPGLPWGELITAAGGALAMGYGALKHGQASELKKQVEFHKEDADEAYAKLGEGNPTPRT